MAPIIVSDLDENIRKLLSERAALHGRSLEEEVRAILHASTVKQQAAAESKQGLGSQIAQRFADCGLEDEIAEWRGESIQTPCFDS